MSLDFQKLFLEAFEGGYLSEISVMIGVFERVLGFLDDFRTFSGEFGTFSDGFYTFCVFSFEKVTSFNPVEFHR